MGDVVVIDAGWSLACRRCQFGEFLDFRTADSPQLLALPEHSTQLEVANRKVALGLAPAISHCYTSIHHVVLATRHAFSAPPGCPALSRCAPMSALLNIHNSIGYVFLPTS
jgi:hypothetical protein